MANEKDPKDPKVEPRPSRRTLVGTASTVAMGAGLVAGYGGLAAIAGRFLYPARPEERQWMFVAPVSKLRQDETLVYRAPSGATVNITRKATSGEADDFVALSSVCPHLGCNVHWEAQNNHYFCPCHNGTFDPEGVGTGGPPGDAGQSLARYELSVDAGLLYIRVATVGLADAGGADGAGGADDAGEVIEAARSRAGHDPCLSPQGRDPRGRKA